MLGQVFVHQVVEVPTVANLFAAAAATEPWPLGIDRLTQCCAKAPLQRIGDLFPFDESAPTDESVEMSRRGANLVKTPVFLFADMERCLNHCLLHCSVELHGRVLGVAVVMGPHLRIRWKNAGSTPHLALRAIREPRAVRVEREQVDSHAVDHSRGCISAGLAHLRIFIRSYYEDVSAKSPCSPYAAPALSLRSSAKPISTNRASGSCGFLASSSRRTCAAGLA